MATVRSISRGLRPTLAHHSSLTHPQLFTTVDQHVRIETSGELTRGMTVIDKRGLIERLDPNCTVVWDVDAEAAFDVIVDSIGSFSN